MNRNQREYKYDLMRVFLTLLVVVGHSTYYTIQTPFGGIDYDGMMSIYGIKDSQLHVVVKDLTALIYMFHMPAFFALSGSLFRKQIISDRWKNVGILAHKKFERLIMPCVFVWICWNIPIKYFSDYYTGVKPYYWFVQMVFPECVYLWFLESLFFVFIITYIIAKLKIPERFKMSIIFGLWLISIVYSCIYGNDWIIFGNPFKYTFWFAVGLQYEYISEKCVLIKQKKFNIILLPVWLGLIVIAKLFLVGVIKIVVKQLVVPLLAIILLYYWSDRVVDLLKNKSLLVKLSEVSFGIYLWAEPLNYLIMHYVVDKYGIAALESNEIAMGIYLTRIFGTILVATFITLILRKIKFPIKAY